MRIVKTKAYSRQARKALTTDEQAAVVEVIASSASKWSVIVGTGGARKARIPLKNNKGQSGGARVIYYYLTADETVILLACYTKAKKETITDGDKKAIKAVIKAYKEASK